MINSGVEATFLSPSQIIIYAHDIKVGVTIVLPDNTTEKKRIEQLTHVGCMKNMM